MLRRLSSYVYLRNGKDNSMKVDEVLTMGGADMYINQATQVDTQVVQPRVIQADEPEQGEDYEKAKNRQKGQKKIEVDLYNQRNVDNIADPYMEDEQLAKKVNTMVFALKNQPDRTLSQKYTYFAKKVEKETEGEGEEKD